MSASSSTTRIEVRRRAAARSSGRAAGGSAAGRSTVVERSTANDRAQALAFARRGDRAPVHLDEVAGDRQAEPETPAAAHGRHVSLLERLEDAREGIGTDAAAGVRDDDADASGLRVLGSQRHASALGRELGGVLEDVPEDLLESRAVAEGVVIGRGKLRPQVDALLQEFAERALRHARSTRCRSSGARSSVTLPRAMRVRSSRSSISRASSSTLRRIMARDSAMPGPRSAAALEPVHGRHHGRQRRAQLVGQRREEPVLGRARLLGPLPRVQRSRGSAGAAR